MKKSIIHFLSGYNIKGSFRTLYCKITSIFVGQKFTGSSDESEVSPRGENSPD